MRILSDPVVDRLPGLEGLRRGRYRQAGSRFRKAAKRRHHSYAQWREVHGGRVGVSDHGPAG